MQFILDAHLDLSMNALEWNRDLRLPVEEIRASERRITARQKGHAAGVVSLADMRCGGIGLCVATQIAGCMKPRSFVANWESPSQAWAMTQGQLAWYREMEAQGEMVQVRDAEGLERHLRTWSDPGEAMKASAPIGYVLSLEGADSIVSLDYLERAWDYGLRALGPSHYGVGRYAMGHDVEGGLPACGRDLIRKMDELGMILDLTHLNESCFWEALELFEGPVWASHQNCRSLVDDPRQFSDDQIRAVIQRGGVLGASFDVWMVVPGFVRERSHPAQMGITMRDIADHIEHICQLAGNADHCGIGSDLDGGFGNEQCPSDVDSIADIHGLGAILAERGYAAADITKINHSNFLRVLRSALA